MAEVADPAAARVYAALLRSAGIPVRVHGEAEGPYVLNLGPWAVTRLWVPESARDDAVAVLSEEGSPPDLKVLPTPEPPRHRRRLPPVAAALATAVLAAVLWVLGSRG